VILPFFSTFVPGQVSFLVTRNVNIRMKQQSTLSAFIRQRRKSAGLTQKELSESAGVGYRFIRELEAGKPTLQMHKVNQVLKLFGHELGPVSIDREKWLQDK
jgi:y4mF family transcriptional regulator